MPDPETFPGLPEAVRELIASSPVVEFATLSAAGVPIDTPMFTITDLSTGTVDVATGLAYPAKAERARRHAKVGLLVEGLPDEPVVSIAAEASVRDADIQANLDRYVAETAAYYDTYSNGHPWSTAREAVWYWARIFVCCKPRTILWWPSQADLDAPPNRWEAAADTTFPPSDPAPAARPSPAPDWPRHDWRQRADEVLAAGMPGHLTLVNDDGYPLPMRARAITRIEQGFRVSLPAATPWRVGGAASLCFLGQATFIGRVEAAGGDATFTVERILPTLPMVADNAEIWAPSASTRPRLLARLTEELARRGLEVPRVPSEPPTPTPGSTLRAARMARMGAIA